MTGTLGPVAPAVDDTLRRLAAVYRAVVWVWMLILVLVDVSGPDAGDSGVLWGSMALATVWLGVTLWAATDDERFANPWFVASDGVMALLLSAAGLLAGSADFVSGGWPGSWLFVVAFATNLSWTLTAGGVLLVSHAGLHVLHGLGPGRTAGTFQFLALALVIGWGFDALRDRERLRIEAETALARQAEEIARQHERSQLADHLHDSVLQTLHAIRMEADDSDEVRYLARRQERELRRTIEEFRSPYEDSFKARLLRYRDEVEDLCRGVQVIDVIRDDAPITPTLEIALAAAREALMNAGKHSRSAQIDLYSEITGDRAIIHVRDRGDGFDVPERFERGLGHRVSDPIREAGGDVDVVSRTGEGTEVTIEVPAT